MRLIDADALDMFDVLNGYYGDAWRDAQNAINHTPTIDAVKVVRCGECKHMIADGRCMEFADDGIRPSASDFCSYGERREP